MKYSEAKNLKNLFHGLAAKQYGKVRVGILSIYGDKVSHERSYSVKTKSIT
jgi:hypothetical protein